MFRQYAPPLGEIDQLRHHRRHFAQSVKLHRSLAGIAAGDQHARGAVHVQTLAARLDRHGEPRQSRFEADLVGDYALQRRHMRRAGCDAVTIHIESDGEIERRRALKRMVECQPLESVIGEVAARSLVRY